MTNENHNFTWAIEQLKAGLSVRRTCWEKNHFWVIRDNELGSKRLVNSINEPPIINKKQLTATDWEVVKIPECLFDKVIYSDKGHEHDTLLVNDVFESLNKIRNFIKNKRLPIFNPEEIFSQVKYNNNLTEIIAFMDKELVGRKI